MRIAYVCADQGVPVFGRKGCSVHVQEVVRAFGRLGARVELFTPRAEGEPPPGLENVPVHLVDMKGTKLILGMHELRHLHLYFAFKTKTIFVTTADATHAPAATPR